MNGEWHHLIARLRRAQPRNPDTLAVCDALEQALRLIYGFEEDLRALKERVAKGPFDKKAYMREYMRKRRAKAKARKTD